MLLLAIAGPAAGHGPPTGTAGPDRSGSQSAPVVPTLPDGELLDEPSEVGQGSCSPGTLAAEQLTTCRFPVIGADVLAPYNTLYAKVTGEFGQSSARCVLEGEELVCPDLPSGYEVGTFDVEVLGLTFGEPRASFTVDRVRDGVLGLSTLAADPLPVLSGVPTTIETFRSSFQSPTTDLDLLLRREGSDEIVQRVEALPAGEDFGPTTLTIPGPGRWTLTGCERGETDACVTEGIAKTLQAVAPEPLPLIEDHNDPDAERINLIFVGNGFGPPPELSLPEEARRLLTLDGEPTPIGFEGDVYGLSWGPFSVDPFRDNLGRFNFWYLADETGHDGQLYDPTFTTNLYDPEAFGLGPHVSLITISRNGAVAGWRANASLAALADDRTLGPATDRRLGSVYLPVPPFSEADHEVLTHELAHALFGLRDEYVETEFEGVPAETGHPNCVATEAEAEEIWGDLVGDLDPMYQRWQDAIDDSDLRDVVFSQGEEDFVVGYVTGGCYGPEEAIDVIRPTRDSLMNSNVPVFGAVNRRRAEQVLALWPEPPPPTTTTTSTTSTTVAPPATTSPDQAANPVDADQAAGESSEATDSIGLAVVAGVAAVAIGILLLGGVAVMVHRSRRPGVG
ncbi:MAG: M64 family metallopeptidase [Actinomycetota bacterium]